MREKNKISKNPEKIDKFTRHRNVHIMVFLMPGNVSEPLFPIRVCLFASLPHGRSCTAPGSEQGVGRTSGLCAPGPFVTEPVFDVSAVALFRPRDWRPNLAARRMYGLVELLYF